MPSGESTFELLEMIARRRTKVSIGRGIIQQLQFAEQSVLQVRRNPFNANILAEEVAQPSVPEGNDHYSSQCAPLYHSTGYFGKLRFGTGLASAPPAIGCGTPVVNGNVIGSPRIERTAR